MSLKIIYGLSGSGKTTECYKLMDRVLKTENDKIVYLVPEHISLLAEKNIAKRYDFGKMSRIDVYSFERLAQSVFSKVGPVACDYMDDTKKSIIMRNVLDKLSNKLNVLGKAAKRDDFTKVMLDLIKELKKHAVTPDMMYSASDKNKTALIKLKLADIALIYESYNEFFKYPKADAEDNLRILNERIDAFGLFGDTHIIADGFMTLTPMQMSVLKKLMIKAKSVTVTLICDSLEEKKFSIFQKSVKIASQLFTAANDVKTEVLPNTYAGECKRYESNEELKFLEKEYNNYKSEGFQSETNNIVIMKGSNYSAEAELTAGEILRLCREENYRLNEIAVAVKDTALYFPIISSIFDEYGISYHTDENLNIMQNSFAYGMLSIFDTMIYKFNAESMIKWIKSPLCPVDKDSSYLLENYIIANGSTKSMWEKDDDWAKISVFSEYEMKQINTAKNKARQPVLNFAEKFKGRKTALEIAAAYSEFLKEVKADEITRKKAEKLRDEGMLYDAECIVSVYNSVINTVNSIVDIMGEKLCTFESFYSMVVSGLEGCGLGQIPATTDCVEITSVDRFHSGKAKCLFVLGTNDGVFPSGYIEDGLLSADDRNAINSIYDVKLENGNDKHMSEEFLIYNTISAASDKLYLSYSLSDNEGKTLNPSLIVNKVTKLFPKIKLLSDVYTESDELHMVEGVVPSFGKMMLKDGILWDTVCEWYKNNRPDLYSMYESSCAYTNAPENLFEENVRLIYGEEMYSSVSKAEQYAKCGFAFFLKYGLRADERKEKEISAADAGTFMHAVLEWYSKFAMEFGWENITKEQCIAKSEEITTEVLKNGMSSAFFESERNSYSIKKFINIMSVTLWNVTEYYCNSNFKTLGYEIGFGGDGEYPPIEIKLENGEIVKLTGKVDRADILRRPDGNFVSIVDYKSSEKDIELEQVLCGIQIQLPVYIDAICKSLKNSDSAIIPAAMHYYHISAPLIKSRNADDEDIESAVRKELRMRGYALETEAVQNNMNSMFVVKKTADTKEFEKIIKTAYRQLNNALLKIRSGNISLNPVVTNGKSVCTYCPYHAVCGFEEGLWNNEYKYVNKINREEFFCHVNQVD